MDFCFPFRKTQISSYNFTPSNKVFWKLRVGCGICNSILRNSIRKYSDVFCVRSRYFCPRNMIATITDGSLSFCSANRVGVNITNCHTSGNTMMHKGKANAVWDDEKKRVFFALKKKVKEKTWFAVCGSSVLLLGKWMNETSLPNVFEVQAAQYRNLKNAQNYLFMQWK
jgi:hypothetical protein